MKNCTEEKDKKKSAEGYRGLAMTYYEQEEYSSALDAFKKAVDTGVVQTTQIYNLMGICAMKTEDYEAALEYIQAESCHGGNRYAAGEEEKNSENGKDSAEMIQEMRYNEVVCYEKLADLGKTRSKRASEYLIEYPEDTAMEREADCLATEINTVWQKKVLNEREFFVERKIYVKENLCGVGKSYVEGKSL